MELPRRVCRLILSALNIIDQETPALNLAAWQRTMPLTSTGGEKQMAVKRPIYLNSTFCYDAGDRARLFYTEALLNSLVGVFWVWHRTQQMWTFEHTAIRSASLYQLKLSTSSCCETLLRLRLHDRVIVPPFGQVVHTRRLNLWYDLPECYFSQHHWNFIQHFQYRDLCQTFPLPLKIPSILLLSFKFDEL